MKQIQINQKEIFEIAYFVKQKIYNQKVIINFSKEKINIKIKKSIDKLQLEELKSFLKLKYPYLNFFITIQP